MGQNVRILRIFGCTLIFYLSLEAYKLPSSPQVCESMIPLHLQTITPQSSESPFKLKVSHTNIKSGAHFEITIRSNATDFTFQGFMIQVRNNKTNQPFGKFVRTPESKWLYCSPGKKNVLANNNDHERFIVRTIWACPPKFRGPVYTIATIARNEEEYWVGHKSHTVNIGYHTGVRLKEYDNNTDIIPGKKRRGQILKERREKKRLEMQAREERKEREERKLN